MSAILIVDDDPDLCEVLADLLEHHGYDVATCHDGVEGLDRLHAGVRPVLILLDLEMPRMNGYEFRAAQLADPELAAIPVMLISDQLVIDRARLGLVEIVPRPLSIEHLLAAIEKYDPRIARREEQHDEPRARALP
jgi:CheY-like chemotaxis protein